MAPEKLNSYWVTTHFIRRVQIKTQKDYKICIKLNKVTKLKESKNRKIRANMASGGGASEMAVQGERDDAICRSRSGQGRRVLLILMLMRTLPHTHPRNTHTNNVTTPFTQRQYVIGLPVSNWYSKIQFDISADGWSIFSSKTTQNNVYLGTSAKIINVLFNNHEDAIDAISDCNHIWKRISQLMHTFKTNTY